MALGLRRRAREPGESFGCRPNRPQRSLQERLLGFRALSAGPAKQLLNVRVKNSSQNTHQTSGSIFFFNFGLGKLASQSLRPLQITLE